MRAGARLHHGPVEIWLVECDAEGRGVFRRCARPVARGARGRHLQPRRGHRHRAPAPRAQGHAAPAGGLARRGRPGRRLGHLGDPFHRHAGLRARAAERLRGRPDRPLAGLRRRSDGYRSRGVASRGPALRGRDRRRDPGRRHRFHALYRHDGVRGGRAHRLGPRPRRRLADPRLPARKRGAVGHPRQGQRPRSDGGRAPPPRRHLQPPFHGDGRRHDRGGSDHRDPGNRRPGALARGRHRPRERDHPAPGLLRALARYPRPAPGAARARAPAQPRQRGRRGPRRVPGRGHRQRE